MCGFTGFVNIKEKISCDFKTILENMNQTLAKRGPDEDGYFVSDHAYLAHKRLIVIDPDGGKQPMISHYSYGDYVICYNGQIYNTEEIRNILRDNDVNTEIYLNNRKLKAKFKYADKLEIPFVAVIGEDEIERRVVKLKDMKTGEEKEINLDNLEGLEL